MGLLWSLPTAKREIGERIVQICIRQKCDSLSPLAAVPRRLVGEQPDPTLLLARIDEEPPESCTILQAFASEHPELFREVREPLQKKSPQIYQSSREKEKKKPFHH
ncbi:hypothetical protein VNO77_34377 [Canavalia gladiata]|uniref:Uncharacterized protein n=1 Tax=Canavalia gladiata TaxID=3824 RepID=A0AAN9PZR2_CANGL